MSNPTLTRFFALHYLLPFVIAALAVIHIFFLHLEGSSNPLGISSSSYKVPFHYYYSVKDLYVFFFFFFFFPLCLVGGHLDWVGRISWSA